MADEERPLTLTWVYFPGIEDGGAGKPYMTDIHHGSLVVYGGTILTNDYSGGEPQPMAVLRDGLWYQADGPDHEGRPFVIIESQPCEHGEGEHP